MDNPVISKNSENMNNSMETRQMNFIQRVFGVIFSPSETMKNLVEKPRILFPFILIAASMLLFLLVNFTMYKEFLMESTMEMMSKMNMNLTAEQLQQQASFGSIIGLIGAPIGALIQWLITTVLIFAAVKIFRGEGKFKQFMSITGYAYVIMILYFILATVVSQITGIFNLNLNITSLASLLSDDMRGTFVYGVLNAVELFTIWELVVIGIGITLAGKLSKSKTYSIIAGVYVLLILYSGVAQTMSNMFG